MLKTIYTTGRAALLADAAQTEREANESLTAWVILGCTDKYSAAMRDAAALRAAASEPNIWARREILRKAGFTVSTPKHAGRK